MHASHHDVEAVEQCGFLVKTPVAEDVDLDPGEDSHRRERISQLVYHVELFAQPACRKAVGDRQPW